VIADDLARQPDTHQPTLFQPRLFGDCHSRRFAVDELDSTGRASRVSTTRMEDVDARILLNRKHKPLAFRHIN